MHLGLCIKINGPNTIFAMCKLIYFIININININIDINSDFETFPIL